MLQSLKNLPVILDLRKTIFENKFSSDENVNYFRGIYGSFSEAELSSPKTKPKGYDNTESASLYKERTNKIYSTDYPVLFWMNNYKTDIKKVFDFGGHIGIHYYSFSKLLDFSGIESWTVCDVPSVAEEGRKYSEQRGAKNLNFVSNIQDLSDQDLFLASGSLQYLDWEIHEKFFELKKFPKYLIFNMLPLHSTTSTITLQSIGTAFCPYYIRKENDFIKGLESIGYELVDLWSNEEKKCHIAFEKERSLNYYRGLVFRFK
ncbi:methyltransferase, TIGR04325 family [Bacteriovorax stolpii]|uniref:Methyltransferase, TIGR04325 family n=1 Tax=Bacteriovorax stolpii TaxID=960 RepID=A0A2K9NQ70_BACTC|nr:methyltransferase, TIGR04325 family [Bacteriovorax stolpii]AUN97658.1 methyltransferase, TIGR04325 family [Bacteriovorax stolpii]TDP52840.1 putative methyltransferase (TIGR04325 family) [Bacteriovorax stolpii]